MLFSGTLRGQPQQGVTAADSDGSGGHSNMAVHLDDLLLLF